MRTLPVYSVSFSPDGSRIVSGSFDNTVLVWDAVSGVLEKTLEGHTDHVMSVVWHGDKIVSGSEDKTVRVWDSQTGAELMRLEGHTDCVDSVSSSGTLIVSGSDDKTVRVWDSHTGAELMRLEGHREYVSSVSFSPDGSRIVSGSWDKTVRVWDVSVINEWVSLVRDIQAWKQVWDRNDMPFALMLQKAVWYASSLEKLKAKADEIGFQIDIKLFEILLTWCSEYIKGMAGNRPNKSRRLDQLRLRF